VIYGSEWSTSRLGHYNPGKILSGTLLVGGWVGSRAGLYAVQKRKPVPGIEHEFFCLSPRVQTERASYKASLNNPIYRKIHLPVEFAIIKIYEGESVNFSQME
jgi:hypothetical protein